MPDPVPESDGVVALIGVTVDIERVPVLRRLDLAIGKGESVGIVGANGSGKSTLLRVLATLLPLTEGRGRVLGAELGGPGYFDVRPRIALVGHSPALYSELTLRENLNFIARLTGRGERMADHALDQVGLARAADRRVTMCSQGMRRRAELARVLLTEPRLLLLDEAHTGLDEASVSLVGAMVDRVRDGGGASVVVSHDHRRLSPMVDRVVEITNGRAVAWYSESSGVAA